MIIARARQAAADAGATFPLVEAGFTKDDIRLVSKELGLRTWDKPAAACLASRLPYGTPVTLGRLKAVDAAESALRALGFGQLRVRHHGPAARLEFEPEDLGAVLARRGEVVAAVQSAGFRFVALDLEGFTLGQYESDAGGGRRGERVSQVRVKLTFPESEVRRPVLATLVRQFDVEPNIRRADVEEHRGWIVCELDGERPQSRPPSTGCARRASRSTCWATCSRVEPTTGLAGSSPGRSSGPRVASVLAAHLPSGLGDLAGLVEDAAFGAGEGERLVGVHLAALQPVAAGRGPHHVVAAILVDGHGPFWPIGRGAVASSAVDRNVPLKTLLRWSESLAAIARTGLGFTESLYEQERFEEILKVAADIRVRGRRGARATPTPPTSLVQEWMDTVGKGVPGYVTPKVAVGAAVGNDKGELLLIQRADSGIWLYPTGWCDVGYSAAEVVVKEVEEETGIEVEPVRLIAVLDGLRLGFTRVPLYSLLVLLPRRRRHVGTASRSSAATSGWFTRDTMPSPIVGSERWADTVFAALAGEHRDVLYDSVRQPMWRGDAQKI